MGVDLLNIEGLKALEHQGPISDAEPDAVFRPSLPANGSAQRAAHDRLREAIHETEDDSGLLRRVASRNDVEMIG
jgi:hypothetical protein